MWSCCVHILRQNVWWPKEENPVGVFIVTELDCLEKEKYWDYFEVYEFEKIVDSQNEKTDSPSH